MNEPQPEHGASHIWPPRTFADHFQNAVAWLQDGYGERLTEEESKSIVRVLWSRAKSAQQTADSRI